MAMLKYSALAGTGRRVRLVRHVRRPARPPFWGLHTTPLRRSAAGRRLRPPRSARRSRLRAATRGPRGWWIWARPGRSTIAGDLSLPEGPEARALIEQGVAAVLESGGRPIVLGGDHSITYPVLRAMRRHHPRLSVLHVDAHPDLYEEFEGDRFSHACPFARAFEDGLLDELVQVGIRAMTGAPASAGRALRRPGDRHGRLGGGPSARRSRIRSICRSIWTASIRRSRRAWPIPSRADYRCATC